MRPALSRVIGVYGGTATKLIFPDALALTLRESSGTEKSYIVANANGEIINSSGNQVVMQVFYSVGQGIPEEKVDKYLNLEGLLIMTAAGLTNNGTPFAATSVTLDEYNSTQVAQLSTEWEW